MMQPITFEEFLDRARFSQQELSFIHAPYIIQIVSLRDLKRIETVMVMPRPYLERLLSRIGLVGAPDIKVYEKCPIRLVRIDPSQLYLGQRYVYRKKYTSIMENFIDLFREFSITRGISKLTALIVLGKDNNEIPSLAHYLPPIIEVHANKTIIMDGVNRNFIIRNSGTTSESIVVENVNVTFPCMVHPWDDISVIDDKPEKQEDRYFDFRPQLFRDLKSVGIDG